jgi:hypothetical protein
MPMKYPNILYTTLLSAFLLVPFAIREFAPTLEPYPAVLLPSGAGRIKTAEDQVDFDRTAIYGRVAGRDSWTRLMPSQFLNPVPPEFFPPLAQRYFRLSPIGPITHTIKGGVVIRIDTHKVGEEEVKNAKQWFRARLNGSGCDDKVLRITQEVVTLRRSDGAEIAVRYQNDKVYELR